MARPEVIIPYRQPPQAEQQVSVPQTSRHRAVFPVVTLLFQSHFPGLWLLEVENARFLTCICIWNFKITEDPAFPSIRGFKNCFLSYDLKFMTSMSGFSLPKKAMIMMFYLYFYFTETFR